MSSTHETIGTAAKLEAASLRESGAGVAFELEYGPDLYGITLSNNEMDRLLDKTYATEVLGRESISGSGFVIELENPDLPLFALPHSLHIEKNAHRSAAVSLGIGIVTMSHVHEQRGILLASRHTNGTWEFESYNIQPPLRDPEEVFAVD